MDTGVREPLGGAEFAPETTYLNTSSSGLLPRRAVDAVRALAGDSATGRDDSSSAGSVEAARESFGRIAGVPAERVAVGSTVSAHVGLIAASLEAGDEVLVPEGEFSSLVSPFSVRGDLKLRQVPLDALAGAVRPGTALVALSSVQSADGRLADLAAVRTAAAAHGARTLLDASQSAGWLPLEAGAYDYTVTGGFKYLLGPRGTSFLTVTEEAQESLVPLYAGWIAAADPWGSTYGPIGELARTARRFDTAVSFLSYRGAEQSLALVEEVGIDAVHAHGTALAARFRAGLTSLGQEPVPGGTVIVAVPGEGHRGDALRHAGIITSARAGNLRVSFHLYNSTADVDRALDVLAG